MHRGPRVHGMTVRLAVPLALLGVACLASAAAWCQSGVLAVSKAKPYTAPKNSFGHPNLEGTWTNNSATPLQRPAQWADKATLTDAELEAVKSSVRQLEKDG